MDDAGDLYAKHRARLVSHLLRKGLKREDAEDAVQEVFKRFLERGPQSSTVRDVESWLFGTAGHVAVDMFRARAPMLRDPRDAYVEAYYPAEAEELAKGIDAALTGLPGEVRLLMHLRYWKNWSYGKIAAHLGVTTNAARLRLFRVRRILRQHLDPAGHRAIRRTHRGSQVQAKRRNDTRRRRPPG